MNAATVLRGARADRPRLTAALAGLRGLDGAERPGEDMLLPAGPRVLSAEVLERLGEATERRWALHDATVRAELRRVGPGALAKHLGFDAADASLIAATPSLLAPPVRADFVPTRAGYRLVEWNVDPCLGGLASRRLFECFEAAGVTRGLGFRDPAEAMRPGLARLRAEGRDARLVVAVRAEDLPRWSSNAERLVEVARDAGFDAHVATVDEVLLLAARASTRAPLAVLRLFHLDHALHLRGAIAELLAAAASGRVRLVYGFDTELWGDKQWLACAEPPDDLVPETRLARDVATAIAADRRAWVLKPHAGSAGVGVTLGCETGACQWRAAVARAVSEPGWIAQRFARPRVLESAYVDAASGRRQTRREVETLGIFLVEGRYAGAYARSVAASDGLVVDASASFNVVASPLRASLERLELSPRVRRLWSKPSPAALRRRLRAFEGMAVEHLTGGGGALAASSPERAGSGFRCPAIPELGETLASITRELRADLLPFCHDKRAPEYTAHLDVPPADLSIAAGVIIRALAQDPVTWTSSRAATFMEREVVRWLAGLAFPREPGATGIPCSGGTQANLHGVLLARNLAFTRLGIDVERVGLAEAVRRSGAKRLLVLASSAAHGSIRAAVRHAGLGDEGLALLPVDASDAVRVDGLEEALERARREGDLVALVVLNAGTVGVGAIDPLRDAALVARRHGARVHVDAAHGAMLLFSRRHAPRLDGLALADSVTADPHKILGLNQGLGMLLLRDERDRERAAKDPAPYFVDSPGAPAWSRFTLDGTRPLQALGAWILLRHLGRRGYEKVTDHLLALSARFTEGLLSARRFELFAQPAMNLVAFRPRGADERALAGVAESVARGGFRVSLYQSKERGAYLRAVFVNPATTGREVDGLLSRL